MSGGVSALPTNSMPKKSRASRSAQSAAGQASAMEGIVESQVHVVMLSIRPSRSQW